MARIRHGRHGTVNFAGDEIVAALQQFKIDDTRTSAPIARELNALVDKHGKLHPDDVVKAAKSPKSAMHKRFTWDDTEAGIKLRRLEAMELIREVKVICVTQEKTFNVRGFHSLGSDRLNGGGYRPIAAVMSDTDRKKQLLETAMKEFQSLKMKYQHLVELSDVFAAIDALEI